MITNLKNLSIVNPNYIACLMWKDQYGRTYRYQLWESVGETVPLGFPLYSGQLIKKNFRIEIWSINGQNITETVGDNLITSVLQGIDYRYGNDGPLSSNDGEVTNFACNATSITQFPTTMDAYLQARWLAALAVNGQPWVSSDIHAYSLTSTGGPGIATSIDNTLAENPVVEIVGTNISPGVAITPGHLFITMNIPAQGNSNIYNFDSGAQLLQMTPGPAGFATLTLEDGNTVNVPLNTWVIVEIGYSNAGTSFIRYFTLGNRAAYTVPTFLASTTNLAPRAFLTISNVLNGPSFIADIEIYVGYLGAISSQLILNYLYDRYCYTYALPLVFPANSSPQPNTI